MLLLLVFANHFFMWHKLQKHFHTNRKILPVVFLLQVVEQLFNGPADGVSQGSLVLFVIASPS
jgi:hypothetical protein